MGNAIGKTLLRRLVRDINHAGTEDDAGAGIFFDSIWKEMVQIFRENDERSNSRRYGRFGMKLDFGGILIILKSWI